MDKKNVWSVLAGFLFCMAVGKFINHLPMRKTEPSPEIEKKTKKMELLTPEIVRMKVSAYCPCEKCCGIYADGKTSIGRDALESLGVAAAPKLLPYGTKLQIPGIGIREVDDTGGAMRKSAEKGIYHIDIRFHNHEEALKFGVQWLDVEILNRPQL